MRRAATATTSTRRPTRTKSRRRRAASQAKDYMEPFINPPDVLAAEAERLRKEREQQTRISRPSRCAT